MLNESRAMTTTHPELVLALLDALLELAERPVTNADLALRLATGEEDVAAARAHLVRRGLLHPAKLRLTLSGLAAATALRAHRRRRALPTAA